MTIELLSLVVFGHHGYLEAERRLGQRFLVDLWVDVDEEAAKSDDIDHTVDYRHLAALVRETFAGPEKLLLEGLAGAVADGVIERFPAHSRCACGCASRTSCSTRRWSTRPSFSSAAAPRYRPWRARTSVSAPTSDRARRRFSARSTCSPPSRGSTCSSSPR